MHLWINIGTKSLKKKRERNENRHLMHVPGKTGNQDHDKSKSKHVTETSGLKLDLSFTLWFVGIAQNGTHSASVLLKYHRTISRTYLLKNNTFCTIIKIY